ncbi:MAG TPA: DUF378 domain-containing protein [Rhabdochlamydiaceae bacterium]|jgi:hypothetical protein|nr:DUF378 domain-containing protein [Rhabdochlamydiaceae bacterium]
MKKLNVISAILLWIGGINWGLIGAADFNLLGLIFGGMPVLLRIIFILVGLAAVQQIFHCKACKKCAK